MSRVNPPVTDAAGGVARLHDAHGGRRRSAAASLIALMALVLAAVSLPAIATAAVPPAPTITSAPANPTTATSASFTFTDTDATATFECRLDGAAYAACVSPKAYSGLSFAAHTFRVRARNVSGFGSELAYAWTVNRPPAPPAATITASPTNPTTATSASFSFTDTDATATFECSLDTAAFAACTSPQAYAGPLALGNHTFRLRARTSSGAAGLGPTTSFTWTVSGLPRKTRLLLVSADGQETDFPALKSFLDQIGVPYTTLIASQTPLTPDMLSDGTTGKYQGVILTTGNLTHYNSSTGSWESAFTPAEWQTLWSYEAAYRVRQVTSFTYPYGSPDDYGLNLVTYQDTLATPLQATLTAAGKSVFPYLNAANPITFKGAWVYLATKRDSTVTPLITTSDGYVIASTNTYPDGRENLAVTAANNPSLLHSQLLSYGLINWVTRGVFLGERHANLDVEIDDLLIDSDMWDMAAKNDLTGLAYRMSPADFDGAIAWQTAQRARSTQLSQVKLEWAFNGEGAFGDPPNFTDKTGASSVYPNDTLTPDVVAKQSNFNYINHTYTHQNVDLTTYASSLTEIQDNQRAATALGLTSYSNRTFVQPDISGLTNGNFLQAAWDAGVRYLITDTSVAAWNNPSPNAGFLVGAAGKQLLAIPRHPSNLFYNLRTPEEFVDEYNWYYWKGSPSNSQWKFWDTPQTYAQIVDHESDNLLGYLLRGDIDPLMFHQANVGLYDGQHSLLGDLLDATFTKYLAVTNLPIRNQRQDQVGQAMAKRMAFNNSGVDGTLTPCVSLTLSVTNAATIPVTGLAAGTTETYGGQTIGNVAVAPGAPTTVKAGC
jgi:hypothetical protein